MKAVEAVLDVDPKIRVGVRIVPEAPEDGVWLSVVVLVVAGEGTAPRADARAGAYRRKCAHGLAGERQAVREEAS
jgi:hypothetical protein